MRSQTLAPKVQTLAHKAHDPLKSLRVISSSVQLQEASEMTVYWGPGKASRKARCNRVRTSQVIGTAERNACVNFLSTTLKLLLHRSGHGVSNSVRAADSASGVPVEDVRRELPGKISDFEFCVRGLGIGTLCRQGHRGFLLLDMQEAA